MTIPVSFGHLPRFDSPASVLAGDVGATKTNLAIFEFAAGGFEILKEQRFHTKDFDSLDTMVSQFLGNSNMPGKICFGVAGPLKKNRIRITNLPTVVDQAALSSAFNRQVYLVNDLEATAFGLSVLEKKDIHVIFEPQEQAVGNIAVIAPGTGLGEAGLYWDGKAYHPFATEGGHCDFASRNEMDCELFAYLHKKYDHVSWERVLSGPGIAAIFDFLHTRKDRTVPPWLAERILAHDPAEVISQNAEDVSICGETMHLFLRYLATESANLALKFKATGGVYIGGGILPRILRLVHTDHFLKWFRDAGRMKPLLEDIPVNIILNDRAALLGAAFYGASRNETTG
jgi:glucokinase